MKKMTSLALILLLFVSGCSENAIPGSPEAFDNSPVSAPQITDGEENVAPDPSDTGDDDVKVIIPDFTTTDLEGNTVTQDIFSGKDLTVVNIWGTYCGPCINEMPELGEWAAEMPDNVQLLGIVCDLMTADEGETLELAQDIVARTGAGYTNIAMCDGLAWIAYSVQGVPTTFFVNGSGEIVGQAVLGAYVDRYKAQVEVLLHEDAG